MASTYQLLLGGQQAEATLYTLIVSVEVDESMDMPAAIQITLPISRDNNGELTYVNDARFGPLAPVAIVATAGGSGAQGVATGAVGAAAAAVGSGSAPPGTQCIFDGYLLAQKIHLETGATNAKLTVWGQDVCWLMNQTENVREWVDVTDADVAATLFGEYGITPSDQNTTADSPSHTEDTHSLMQRGTDIAFLRMLARRSGKVCRVACADQPGVRTGYFAIPKLDGDPAVRITLNDSSNWTVGSIDLEWDATLPTSVVARSALFSDSDPNGAVGDSSDSGLQPLGDRTLAAFAGKPTTVMLTTAVDSRRSHATRAGVTARNGLVRALRGRGGCGSSGGRVAGRDAGGAGRRRRDALGRLVGLDRSASVDARGAQNEFYVVTQ